jgi:hypothetical protein
MTTRQPLHHYRPGYPLPVRPWRVTTTQGTVEVLAATLQHAILSGLELAGPGACLVRCVREGEW